MGDQGVVLTPQGNGGMALVSGVGRQGGMGAGPVATVEEEKKRKTQKPPASIFCNYKLVQKQLWQFK